MFEDAVVDAIYCSLRGFSEEVTAAGDTRYAYTVVDADHPTQTLNLTRTLWGDLCLDAKKVPRVVGMEKPVALQLSCFDLV